MAKTTLHEKISHIEKRLDSLEKQFQAVSSPDACRRMLNAEEAAQFLGITLDGLRGLTHKKLISYYKPNGKNIYFDVGELVAWQKKNHFEPVNAAREV